MRDLIQLSTANNQINDISALRDLSRLETLWISNNQISDISPLKELKNIKRVYMNKNPLDKDAVQELKEILSYTEVYY